MITIIDYGLGNIQAFLNIYKKLHIEAKVARTMLDLESASKIILPGVGHFDNAMKKFNNSGMREKVENLVLGKNVPILGVCVGMQMMANISEEGNEPGLGWISGRVRDLKSIIKANNITPLPHMGWNTVKAKNNELFKNIDNVNLEFYFLHSYFFDCEYQKNSIALTSYNSEFCCAINNKNIFGVQFHPEKSHKLGVKLLMNFANLDRC